MVKNLKKIWAVIKIVIPFTKITIYNIKEVLKSIEDVFNGEQV